MDTKVMQLSDGTFVEVELSQEQVQKVSGGKKRKLDTSFERIIPVLKNVCQPISSVWKELNKELHIEQTEVEIGLSFEGEGNIFITRSKASANLVVKMTFRPKV